MKPLSILVVLIVIIGLGFVVYATMSRPAASTDIRDLRKDVQRGARDANNGTKDAAEDAKDAVRDPAK
jgi:hypothetical protein